MSCSDWIQLVIAALQVAVAALMYWGIRVARDSARIAQDSVSLMKQQADEEDAQRRRGKTLEFLNRLIDSYLAWTQREAHSQAEIVLALCDSIVEDKRRAERDRVLDHDLIENLFAASLMTIRNGLYMRGSQGHWPRLREFIALVNGIETNVQFRICASCGCSGKLEEIDSPTREGVMEHQDCIALEEGWMDWHREKVKWLLANLEKFSSEFSANPALREGEVLGLFEDLANLAPYGGWLYPILSTKETRSKLIRFWEQFELDRVLGQHRSEGSMKLELSRNAEVFVKRLRMTASHEDRGSGSQGSESAQAPQ